MFLLPRYQEGSPKLCTHNLVLLNSVSFNGIQSSFQRSEMFLAMLMFLLDYGNVSYFPLRLLKKKINVKVLASDQSCREKRKTDQELSLDGWREREQSHSITQLRESLNSLCYERMTLNLVILMSNVGITAICYYTPQLIHTMFSLDLES